MKNADSSLYAAAHLVLMCRDVEEKIQLTKQLHATWFSNSYSLEDDTKIESIAIPGRPEKPELVAPRKLMQRKLSSVTGQAALIHAVAHIEFNAINLALDAVYRFRGLPAARAEGNDTGCRGLSR